MSKQSNLAYRFDLQGLRAVAVLLVVFAHAGFACFSGGFIGVDVFFVLSGYLISSILMNEFAENQTINFSRFYAKRLKRLLPALALVIVATVAISFSFFSPEQAKSQLSSAPFSSVWVSNFYFSFNEVGYFDELSSKDLFLHTWSLGVEEQFYLIWPVFLLSLSFLGVALKNKTSILMLLVISAIVSFIFSIYLAQSHPNAAFYMMPSRFWQFALGATASFIVVNNIKLVGYKRLGNFVSYGSLLAICLTAFVLDENYQYPSYWALIPSTATFLIIVFSNNRNYLLTRPIMVWMGDRSYSLYLWHWPVLIIGFALGYQNSVFGVGVMLVLALVAAVFSYAYIELPFWKGKFNSGRNKMVILLSILAMLLMTLLTSQLVKKPLSTKNIDNNIAQQWRSDLPAIYKYPCDTWYYSSKVEPCFFGQGENKKNVVLLGDSIGAQWFSLIPKVFNSSHWNIIVLTKSSCPMVDEPWFYARIKSTYTVCSHWRNVVLEELENIKPEVIVLGSSSTYGFSEKEWVQGSQRIFSRLSKISKKVFVINGTPKLGVDGPGCIERNIQKTLHEVQQRCQGLNKTAQPEEVLHYLNNAAKNITNVHVLDFTPWVCPRGVCYAISQEKVVVYRDSQHLTDSFVRSIAEHAGKTMRLKLKEVWPGEF